MFLSALSCLYHTPAALYFRRKGLQSSFFFSSYDDVKGEDVRNNTAF